MLPTQNLSEEIKGFVLQNELLSEVGSASGLEMKTRLALAKVATLVVNGLADLSQKPDDQNAVWETAREAYTSSILTKPREALRAFGAAANRGADLIRPALKDYYFGSINGIASSSGLDASSVTRLLNLAVPVGLAFLGQRVAGGQSISQITQWLQRQRVQLPGPEPAVAPVAAMPLGRWPEPGPEAGQAARKARRTNMWLAAALVVAVGEFGYILATLPDSNEPVPAEAVARGAAAPVAGGASGHPGWRAVPSAAIDPSTAGGYPEVVAMNANFQAGGGYVYGNAGVPVVLKLKGGLQQIIGANSTESRLYHLLEDPAATIDTVNVLRGWIGFDRIYFESSKAVLTNESMWQLSNVASILNTFPNSRVRIGGYTDSSGDPLFNLQLSRNRAESAKATLAKFGVDPDRVDAVGYGSQDNIASNDLPEGRALNRRVSIRVLEK